MRTGLTWSAMMVCLLLGAHPVQAVEYVVDATSQNASDTGPGTAQAPFKTIGQSAAVARAGDVVAVRSGVYREDVRLRHNGKPGAPIVFQAVPPGSVVVSGADPLTGWQRVSGTAPIYAVAWNHLFAINWHRGKPVEHHPADAPLWGRAEQVIADGNQLLPALSLEALRQAWQARPNPNAPVTPPLPHLGGPFVGRFAVDTVGHRLYAWLVDGSSPAEHAMQASTRSQTFGVNPWESRQGVSWIVVRGFVFRYGASFPQRPVVWLHGRHNLLEDSTVEDMAGSGVGVSGTLRRCVIRGCGQTGGAAGGDGFLNTDCLWEDNCWKPINRQWDAGGVKLAEANGGAFRHCVFRHNGGPGLWFDIHCRNVTISDCVFDGNEGSGLFIEISRDFTVTHNLCVSNAVGAVGSTRNAGWASAGIQLGESESCILTGNTCVDNKDGIALREQGPRELPTEDFGDIPYHNTGHVIVGNVLAYNHGYQLGLWYDNGFFGWHPAEKRKYKTEAAYAAYLKTIPDRIYDPRKQGLVIDRNLYALNAGQKAALYGVEWRPKHEAFNHLAGFSARTGFDAHGREDDPGFVGRAAGNYRLRHDGVAWRMQVGWLSAPGSLKNGL
jgi:trimeric autotransporter adhesin